jgi:hypothetical protein
LSWFIRSELPFDHDYHILAADIFFFTVSDRYFLEKSLRSVPQIKLLLRCCLVFSKQSTSCNIVVLRPS